MGRLVRGEKRVDRLLHIWSKAQHHLPEWQLRIYGSGEEEEQLKGLTQELGLLRCHFEGQVQYPDVAYRSATVLCMTSNYEGFPLAMVEAQCHGVVPMAFDVSTGIRYVVGEYIAADGSNRHRCRAGVLLPAFDLDAYAEELVALCQDEDALRELQVSCLAKAEDYAPMVNDAQWLDILS